MHPEIISEEPGLCPICNMKLIPKRDSGTEAGGVKVSPVMKQNMGLVTAPVTYRNINKAISTFGKVAVPDPNLYQVSVKTKGWAEKLFVAESGEQVFRGQPLLEIYSPDMVAAQKELLVALADPNNQAMQRLVRSARERLQNWDISDDQLANLEKTGEVSRTMIIRSPADGFVSQKNIIEGSRVEPNKVLYEIADISDVWITGEVYEQDLPHLSLNQTARVLIPSLPGREFNGRVSYIAPLIDDGGQVEVRITINNDDLSLKPEMYAEVTLEQTSGKPVLTIPRKAVINSGKRQVVYIAEPDQSYHPIEIVTGAVGKDDMIEVVSGLSEGDEVVVSGQFLIDSESRLSEAIKSGGGMDHSMPMDNMSHDMSHEDSHDMNHQDSHDMSGMKSGDMSHGETDDPYNIYTCPMPVHHNVLNYGPGKCSECGMDLVPITETDHAPVYVCPMPQCKTVSEEPGNCPVCNMKLIEYKPEGSHD